MKAYLDVAVLRCPDCGRFYVDASWYVIEMESDIKCGSCKAEFNSKKNAMDRVLLEFQVDDNGKIEKVKIAEHLKLE
ncbi:MAG: hypothetical protein QXJ53_01640 [Candidatus Bathyarchaeia archaeon]